MKITEQTIAEIRFLTLFNLATHQEGVKVHHTADPQLIAAAESLYAKGLIDQHDGGYLTDLGIEAAEHAEKLLIILGAK